MKLKLFVSNWFSTRVIIPFIVMCVERDRVICHFVLSLSLSLLLVLVLLLVDSVACNEQQLEVLRYQFEPRFSANQ